MTPRAGLSAVILLAGLATFPRPLVAEARRVFLPPDAPAGYVQIPAGSFTMGSPTSEEGRADDETEHTVTLTRDFFLKATEVTQGEWRALMGTSPSYFASCGDDCPVERVNWYEAVAYVNALSRAEGLTECYTLNGCSGTLGGGSSSSDTGGPWCTDSYACSSASFVGLDCDGYRLPTEAEWEYGARAGSAGRFYDGAASPASVAWYTGNSSSATHRVAAKTSNAWGLFDMHGNVWEWTGDWYGGYGGTATDPIGPSSGSMRVHRGGGWICDASLVRAAVRGGFDPAIRRSALGFRPARSVVP